jgi:hypothetical protein
MSKKMLFQSTFQQEAVPSIVLRLSTQGHPKEQDLAWLEDSLQMKDQLQGKGNARPYEYFTYNHL